MQKKALQLILILVLTGCSTTPWNEGMCPVNDKKEQDNRYQQCYLEWDARNQGFFSIGTSSLLITKHMELVSFNCNAKAKWKECD